jgi:hypothetical protein
MFRMLGGASARGLSSCRSPHRPPLTDTLDSRLTARLRDVLARGDTTEADLRELTDEAAGWVRLLRAQVLGSERRLRALNADPSSPISEIADELRRLELLRPRLREARELARQLDERARELRTGWLRSQADARRTS